MGREAKLPPFLGRVTLGSAQRRTVPSKPEVIYDLGFLYGRKDIKQPSPSSD